MRILIFSIFLSIVSCSKNNCGELSFDKNKKITYLNGRLYSGDCESFFYTGQLKSEESYKNGVRHGVEKWYDISGKLERVFPHKNGEIHGLCKGYYESGELRYEHPYVNGEAHGVYKYYYKY